MNVRRLGLIPAAVLGLLLLQASLLLAQTAATADQSTTGTLSAAESDRLYRATWRSAYPQLMLAAPDHAISDVNAALKEMPKAPGLFLLRAAAEAQKGDWKAASADCNEAETYNLAPDLRGLEATILAVSPNPVDRQNAIRNATVALGVAEDDTFNDSDLMKGVMALRRLQSPAEFLATLQAAHPTEAHRGQAIDTYVALLEDPAIVAPYLRDLSMGLRAPLQASSATAASVLDQAVKLFGDQPDLDTVRVEDDVLRGRDEAAVDYGRQHAKLHPDAVRLAAALRTAETRWALQLLQSGKADQAASAIGAPAPGQSDDPETAILRARILAAHEQYKPALAVLMQASLRFQSPTTKSAPLQGVMAFIEARHASNQMKSQDFLYWQGLIAFEAGDYAMAASAMQYSDQVTKWIDPKADYILALSQEKLGKQDAARASWSRMLEHSRYTVYQDFALAGLRRTGGHATAEQRSTFNTIEGNLTSIDCRQGQPYGVMIANGSVEYPARVTRAVLVSAHLPLTCGPLAKSVWVEGSMRPVVADMPLYAGAATELRAVPNRMMYLSPGKAERRTVVFRKHMTH